MPPPKTLYQPYASVHEKPNGPGDARPTTYQILKDCDALGRLKGKTVLITGCNVGIGVETARAIYETGATLFVTARDLTKMNAVIDDIVQNAEHNKSGPRPQVIEIHLDSLDSVRKGAQDFKQKSGGKLNILINNAGVMDTPFGTTKDGIETQLGVNHFAHFLLFQLVKPLLLASAKESGTTSRVINLSSAGHRYSGLKFSNKAEFDAWNRGEGYADHVPYGQSKTANIYMASSISRLYGDQNLHGWAVHPGGIKTELVRHWTDDAWSAIDFDKVMPIFKSPQQGAATTIWTAVSPHFEGKNGGQYLEDCGEVAPRTSFEVGKTGYAEWAYDEAKEDFLWNFSCDVVGVSDKE